MAEEEAQKRGDSAREDEGGAGASGEAGKEMKHVRVCAYCCGAMHQEKGALC